MHPVGFRRTAASIPLISLVFARGAARFAAVVTDDHPKFPLRAPARAHRAVRSVPPQAQPGCGPVQASARVRLAPYRSREAFERDLRTIPAVRSAVRVVGDVDYELRLRCSDLADLAAVLTALRRVQGIEIASTSLVLGEVKGLGRTVPSIPGPSIPGPSIPAPSIPDWRKAPRPRETRSA